MKAFSKLNAILIKILEWLLALLLFGSVLLILAQVFTRYVLHAPLGWTEQTARFLFIWMMMLGVAIMFYRDSAMSFDLLLHTVKGSARFIAELLIKLLVIFFSGYYGYYALVLVSQVTGRYTSGVRVPLAFMYSSMFISNIFVILIMLEKVLLMVGAGKKKPAKGDNGK